MQLNLLRFVDRFSPENPELLTTLGLLYLQVGLIGMLSIYVVES